MRISVVTVCFNAAATIEAACRSVDAQSHADLEHLVIDGASTDGTLDRLAGLSSSVRVVLSEPDAGLYDAMNKGLSKATGEVVGFLNADDSYMTSAVLRDVAQAFADGADAVYADIDMVDAKDTRRVIRRWRCSDFARWKVYLGWHMPHPGLFVRREVLQEISPFDTSFRLAADYDLMLRLMRKPGVVLKHLPLTAVRMTVGGVSTAGLQAHRRGFSECARALSKHVGPVWCYPIAVLRQLRKLPQWWVSRADRRAGPARAGGAAACCPALDADAVAGPAR